MIYQTKNLYFCYCIVYSYFTPFCSIVKTITPRGCGRPDALLHEAEGRVQYCIRSSKVPRGSSLTMLQTGMKELFYYPTHLMKYLTAFLEWSCYGGCGFVAKQNISPNLLRFGLKIFCSFLLRKRVHTLYVSDHKQQSCWTLKLPSHASMSPLLHNVSFHKRIVPASSSRKSISACVFLSGKRETRPW